MVSKVSFKLDLKKFDINEVPSEDRAEARQEIAEFIKDRVLEDISNSRSSVTGRRWKGLSSNYKEYKSTVHGDSSANLELHGDMLDSFDYRINGNFIEIGVFGRGEADKAAGHNQHTKHKKPKYLPVRRFIPDENENFRSGILSEIRSIVEEFKDVDDE